MSKEMYLKIKRSCPCRQTDSMPIDDVYKAVETVFKKIGYEPKDLDNDFNKARELDPSDGTLAEFIYDVWRCGN